MAQRAAGFSKKKLEVVKTASNDAVPAVELAPVAPLAPAVILTLPLQLAPLLTPYKRHGRLSLRVERVPQLARLSGGRNNGDGTWSLASDELEDLSYLMPDDTKPHALTVRIMAFDGSAAFTVKVLDLPISADASGPIVAPDKEGAGRSAPDSESGAELRRLQDELAEARTALAFRETELAESRQELQQARTDLGKKDEELAAARAAWKGELDERLSAVTAQVASEIQRARKTWQAEQDTMAAGLTARAERTLADEQARWRKESQSASTKAEKAWKAEETKRLAAAEAAWREQSDSKLAAMARRCAVLESDLAKERKQAGAAKPPAEDESARNRLRDELAAAKSLLAEREQSAASALADVTQRCAALESDLAKERKQAAVPSADDARTLNRLGVELAAARRALAEREQALTELRAQTGEAEARWRQESQAALLEAETRWKSEETGRLAAAETAWRDQSARGLAEIAQRCVALEADLAKERARADAAPSPGEIDRALTHLRDELTASQTSLAERDKALAQSRADHEQAQQRWLQENQAALADAETHWKAAEAERFTAAETAWREQFTRGLADIAQRCASLEGDLAKERARPDKTLALAESERELERVRGELADLRTETEQARARWRQELDAALSKAKTAWRTEEDTRVAVAEAQLRAQSEAELALARARCDTAERALVEAVTNAARDRIGDGGAERMGKELAASQASLKEREIELAQLRREAEQDREKARQDAETNLAKAETAWKSDEATRVVAAEARGRDHSAAALADAKARYETAEMALARAANQTAERVRDDAYVERLRKELGATQATLVDREAELVRARSALEQARAQRWPDNNLQVGHNYGDGGRAAAKPASTLLRDFFLVVIVVMAAILAWPRLENYLPDDWRYQINSMTSGFSTAKETPPPAQPTAVKTPASAPAAQQEIATVVKGVNMRADASVSGAVVLTLPRGAQVAVLERRGNWTRVGISLPDGTARQGWVFGSYLKSGDSTAEKP